YWVYTVASNSSQICGDQVKLSRTEGSTGDADLRFSGCYNPGDTFTVSTPFTANGDPGSIKLSRWEPYDITRGQYFDNTNPTPYGQYVSFQYTVAQTFTPHVLFKYEYGAADEQTWAQGASIGTHYWEYTVASNSSRICGDQV